MISREVSITLESDWTHGSGQRGDDNADIAIQRDASGRPLLRGTHLTGLVREALHEVIAMLVNESAKDKAVWKSWLTVLCGNETHAGALSIRTAYADIVTPIGLRPGVAINPDTGTAADDQLRLAQRVGTVKLTTSAVLGERSGDGRRLAWSKDQITAAWLLAEAAMGLVEAVGSERHRGAGRAVMAWKDREPNLTTRLQQLKSKPVSPPTTTAETRPRLGRTPLSEEWHRFTVRLTLSDPLHANAGVRSNTMLGHPYLPGTALLPWLHQQLRRIDDGDIVRDAVVNGGLLAGNAYPVVGSRPTWPAPVEASFGLRPTLRGVDRVVGDQEHGRTTDEVMRTGLRDPAASTAQPQRCRPGGPRLHHRIRVPRQQTTVHDGVPNDVLGVNAAQLLVKPRKERSPR